jgi:hypothetical protein
MTGWLMELIATILCGFSLNALYLVVGVDDAGRIINRPDLA